MYMYICGLQGDTVGNSQESALLPLQVSAVC